MSVRHLGDQESVQRTYYQGNRLAHEGHKTELVVDVFGHHLAQSPRTEKEPIAMYLRNFPEKRTNTPKLAGEVHQMMDRMRSIWLAQAGSVPVPSLRRHLVQNNSNHYVFAQLTEGHQIMGEEETEGGLWWDAG